MTSPYLSVVAVSRNDDHGGDPLYRTQIFINSLSIQAERFLLSIELILIDWNPPEGRPGLAEVLDFPVHDWFYARIVTVPPALHAGFRHSGELPLFQMIGKNAGIRRARGDFVLAANIDILLDDLLFAHIARRNLDSHRMYRADRYDIANIPEGDHDAQQLFCRNGGNQIRRNHRCVSNYAELQEQDPVNSAVLLENAGGFPWAEFSTADVPSVTAKPGTPFYYLNCNACGDFTLLHRDAWAVLRGYPEFEAYSLNIDSAFCIQAQAAEFLEISLLPPLVCYHIEHAPGSGWTPEGKDTLFDRIYKVHIPYLEWKFLEKTIFEPARQEAENPILFNDERWGLAGFTLEETVFRQPGKSNIKASLHARDFRPLSALLSPYQADAIFQKFYHEEDKLRCNIWESQRFWRMQRHPLWKIARFFRRMYNEFLKVCQSIYRKLCPSRIRNFIWETRSRKNNVHQS
jgi:hypothetical protein